MTTSAEKAIYKRPIGPKNMVRLSNMAGGFLEAQRNELTQTLQNALTEFTRNLNTQGTASPSGTLGPPEKQGPPGTENGNNGLKADDISFFNPEYDDKASGNAAVISIGRHTIY